MFYNEKKNDPFSFMQNSQSQNWMRQKIFFLLSLKILIEDMKSGKNQILLKKTLAHQNFESPLKIKIPS